MTPGMIGMFLFAFIGLLFQFGTIEQVGRITDPKKLKRIGWLMFALAIASGLTDSTRTTPVNDPLKMPENV